MPAETATGRVQIGPMDMYWESHGQGGTPLVVVHGGFGLVALGRTPQVGGMSGAVIGRLAANRRVIGLELQGHGHTADIDRPFSYEAFGDDIAAALDELELDQADVMGYSLGAGAALRAAIQHPTRVRKLAVVSIPFRREGWFPEVLATMDQMSSAGFEHMKHTPLYAAYAEVAPDPAGFSALMDNTGALQRRHYDWSEDLADLRAPTLLIYADADSVPTSHIAEFYELLGGGARDAHWDGSLRSPAHLAVLPGRTHYDIFQAPELADVADRFFD
jgi:pimeloyl-ACP methyl ester carboxylesterase